jgi:hypothetical protein
MTKKRDAERARISWVARARAFWWGRVRPFWRGAQWPLIWALGLTALGLGWVGFAQAAPPLKRTQFDNLYLSLQLFVLESNFSDGTANRWLEVARWLAPAVTVYTATKALLAIFHDQFTWARLALLYRRHVVVCGLGRKGYLLCMAYLHAGQRVVVIDSDQGHDRIEGCRQEGALVLVGDAADPAILRKARAHRARLLFSVVGDDGANAETADQTRHLVRQRGGAPTCMIHIDEPQLRDLLSESEFLRGGADKFRMEFFNVYQAGARALLERHPPFQGAGADGTHLLVVGLGRMGQGLVTQLAGEWYEAGLHRGGRLQITVVDRDPDAKIKALSFRHPQVNKLCAFHCWQVDVYSAEFQQAEPLLEPDGRCKVTAAYVCLDDDAHGLYAGLSLRKRLCGQPVSIIVRMLYGAGLSTLIERGGDEPPGRYSNLFPFNLLDETCDVKIAPAEPEVETRAAAVHTDYVRWMEKRGQTAEDNPHVVPWDELPESLRRKNREQARHIPAKLAAVGCEVVPHTDGRGAEFEPEEVELMARLGHEHWRELRVREGWKYHKGPKDGVKKTSPNLVGWEELPEEIKEFNRRAVRAIPDALAASGHQARRAAGWEATRLTQPRVDDRR